MRPQANQLQNLDTWLAVDQQEIRLEMAFAMVAPTASKSMVAVLVSQRLVFS